MRAAGSYFRRVREPDRAGAVRFLLSGLSLILIDLLLAGDNALVIAMAVRSLPQRERRLGSVGGAAVAVALRIALTTVAARLLTIPFLQLAGGLFVLWIAVKVLIDASEPPDAAPSPKRFWEAVWYIVIADLTMSTDNILAIAGASKGDFRLIVFGLCVSIPFRGAVEQPAGGADEPVSRHHLPGRGDSGKSGRRNGDYGPLGLGLAAPYRPGALWCGRRAGGGGGGGGVVAGAAKAEDAAGRRRPGIASGKREQLWFCAVGAQRNNARNPSCSKWWSFAGASAIPSRRVVSIDFQKRRKALE